MEFKCKCGEIFESEPIYEDTGDGEGGPCVDVIDMTVWNCPKCNTGLANTERIEVEV